MLCNRIWIFKQLCLAWRRASILYRVVGFRRGGKIAIRRVLQFRVREYHARTLMRHVLLHRYLEQYDLRQIMIIANQDSSDGGRKLS